MDPYQSPIDKIANAPQFKSFMKTVAVLGVALFVVGIVLKLTGVQKGETLLITGGGMLSVVSFFLGKLFPCPLHVGEALWKFSMSLTGFALAVTIMGLLFVIIHWPGGDKMLVIGVGTLVICAISWLFFLRYYRKNRDIKVFKEQDEEESDK